MRIETLSCQVELLKWIKRRGEKLDAREELREKRRRKRLMKPGERRMRKEESVVEDKRRRRRLNCEKRKRQDAQRDVSEGPERRPSDWQLRPRSKNALNGGGQEGPKENLRWLADCPTRIQCE